MERETITIKRVDIKNLKVQDILTKEGYETDYWVESSMDERQDTSLGVHVTPSWYQFCSNCTINWNATTEEFEVISRELNDPFGSHWLVFPAKVKGDDITVQLNNFYLEG